MANSQNTYEVISPKINRKGKTFKKGEQIPCTDKQAATLKKHDFIK